MMPAAKQMDPVLGIDIHIIQPPGPVPPVPIPHPFVGMVLDPLEFAPFIGATVIAGGMPAAIAGVEVKAIPPHIPMGGVWVPPPPSNEGEIFMGSSTVSFDGDAASHLMHPVLTCQSVGMPKPPRPNPKKKPKPRASLMLPTTMILAIPAPVLIGGPPTISLMAMGMKAAMAGLGKAFKKFSKSKLAKKLKDKLKKAKQKTFKNMKPGFLKCKVLKAEPVNVISGEVVVEQDDFAISGRIPIEWSRTYGSQSEYSGYCGNGWQTPADIRLEIDKEGQVLFFDSGPGATVFPDIPQDPHPPQGHLSGDPIVDSMTELINGSKLFLNYGQFRIETKDGRIYRFERPNRPIGTHKRHPIVMYIEEIADEYDNYIRFVRDKNRDLIKIEESAGRALVVKSKDGKIHQLQFSHPEEPKKLRPLVKYQYDQDGNLIVVFDALDIPYRFDYLDGKLSQHQDRNGLSFYYKYDSVTKDAKCIHAWGDGGLYDYHFEYKPFLTEYIDSLGNKKGIQFDANKLPIREFDALGDLAKYEYDDVGRTTAIIDGNGQREEYEYDDLGNLIKRWRKDGNSIAISYDKDSNPVRITDPNGNEWHQTWNARHKIIKQSTPLGHKTEYFYDQFGLLKTILDARRFQSIVTTDLYGNIVEFEDPLGNVTRFQTDSFGNVTKETSACNRVSEYQYDAKSRLVRIVNPSGTKCVFKYDAEDNITHCLDESGYLTRLEYEGLGEVSRRYNPDGTTSKLIRNTEEQLIEVINERGQSYRIIRNPRGQIVEEVDYWGKSREFTYDGAGNLTQIRDPLNRVTTFKSDRLGRLASKTFHDGKAEYFRYDPNGNLVYHENEHQRCVRKFDSENRLLEEDQGGFLIENEYDERGNRLRRRSSNGNDIAWDYDGNNQALSVQINNEPLFQIRRDADGYAYREDIADQLTREYEYNRDGLLVRQKVYNQVISFLDRKYEYDPVGNLTSKIDSNKGTTSFTYDPMGRVIERITPKRSVEHFFYDPAGDLLSSNHQYDRKTDLRRSTYKGIDYYFDAAGNLVERNSPNDRTKYEWDGNDRLVKVETQDGDVTEMGYDSQVRRVFKQTGEKRTTFAWDGEQLLSDDTTNWGRREFVYYPDTFEPLAMIDKSGVYYYQNDANGLPQEVTSSTGIVLWSAEYDAFGKSIYIKDTCIDNPLRFQGQYHDTELGLYYNRFRYYDPEIGAFISQDPAGLNAGINLYWYAPNVWGWIDPFGLACKKVKVSKSKYPESFKHAVDSGNPNGPFTVDRAGRNKRRRNNLKGKKKQKGKDLDEWPPAQTKEGDNASVRAISSGDNRGSGATIGGQTRSLNDGDQFEVEWVS